MNKIQYLESKMRELMSSFQPLSEELIIDCQNAEYRERSLRNIIHSALPSYIFDKILGFKVRYRPEEKVNYIIRFRYKDSIGYIAHRKLSYVLAVREIYWDEINDILIKAKEILEQIFSEYKEISLNNDRYMLDNHIVDYRIRMLYFENEAERIQSNLESTNCSEIYDFSNSVSVFVKQNEMKGQLAYNIESYINIVYGYIEHVLTLLLVFVDYKKPFHKCMESGWLTKYDTVFGQRGNAVQQIKNDLVRFKKIYRNRLDHGMFTKEQKIYIPIEGLGNFPFYIGEHLSGLLDDWKVDYNVLIECRNLLKKFDKMCKQKFRLQTMLLDSGIPIDVNISRYEEWFQSGGQPEDLIHYINYQVFSTINMDW